MLKLLNNSLEVLQREENAVAAEVEVADDAQQAVEEEQEMLQVMQARTCGLA